MIAELRRNGVEVRKHVLVEKILTEERDGQSVAVGVVANGREIRAGPSCPTLTSRTPHCVCSEPNACRPTTWTRCSGCGATPVRARSISASKGRNDSAHWRSHFHVRRPRFRSGELVDFHTSSRTFSLYYPGTRPGSDRYTIVASLNAKYDDWAGLSDADYARHKQRLIDESLGVLERFLPGIRAKLDWMEAATPRHHRAFHAALRRHFVRHQSSRD